MKASSFTPVFPVAASSRSLPAKPPLTLWQRIALSTSASAKEWVAARKLQSTQESKKTIISSKVNTEPSLATTFATMAAKKNTAPLPAPTLALVDSAAPEPDIFDVEIHCEQASAPAPDIASNNILESEASHDLMESAGNDQLHVIADCDIDDPFDRLTMFSIDLSTEEITKIMEMTKKKPPPTLPLHHYTSNKLQNAELSMIFVILKYPGTNKYLLFDSLNFFLLQGGRHDCLKEETTIASLIARKCFNIFTAFKRSGTTLAGKPILLPELMPMVQTKPENVTIKDAVSRYAYADRKTNFFICLHVGQKKEQSSRMFTLLLVIGKLLRKTFPKH